MQKFNLLMTIVGYATTFIFICAVAIAVYSRIKYGKYKAPKNKY